MKNISDLKIKKISILIPHIKKNLIYKNSLKDIFNTYIDKKNKIKHEKNKPVKVSNFLNFLYVKGSNLKEKNDIDFTTFTNWSHKIGKWRLKDKNWNSIKWSIKTLTNYSNWVMASSTFDNKKISEVFGENVFNESYESSKIVNLIDSLIDMNDKRFKTFGQPQIFIEVDNLPSHQELNLSNQFHSIGRKGDLNKIDELAISWYYDGNNPGFIYSLPEKRYEAYNYFWMNNPLRDNISVKKIFINNGINEMLFSKKNNWSGINLITLKRLMNSAKNIEIPIEEQYTPYVMGIYLKRVSNEFWWELWDSYFFILKKIGLKVRPSPIQCK